MLKLLGQESFGTVEVRNGDREVYLAPANATAVAAILRRLDQTGARHPRIYVGSTDLRTSSYDDTYFYYLLPNAIPVSRYWESEPGTANRKGSPLGRELLTADVLILDSAYNDAAPLTAPGVLVHNGLNQLVAEHFCPELMSGTFELLRRCR